MNLEKEGAGIGANEELWAAVDEVELHGTTPLACMREMGAGLERRGEAGEYVRRWGRSILHWCELFDER